MSCLRSYIVIQSCLDNTEWVDKYVNWNYTVSSPNAHIFKMYIHLPEHLSIIWIHLWNKHKYLVLFSFHDHRTTSQNSNAQGTSPRGFCCIISISWGSPLFQFPSSCNTCSPPSGLCSMGQTCLFFHLWRERANCYTAHTWHYDSYSSLNQISPFH